MKFKLDENIPDIVRESLSAAGYDCHTVTEEGLDGARDETVLHACVAEARILITLDLDFSDIRAYPPGSYPGIWVRLTKEGKSLIWGLSNNVRSLMSAICLRRQ